MINVSEASQIILANSQEYGIESVDFMDSLGRVLKEEIRADRDFPPFDRVCMDGISVSHKIFSSGQREFKIEGVQAAGSPQMTLVNLTNCLEVMTGAILPVRSDVVIPYELIEIENGIAKVSIDEVKELQNIHLKGKDKLVGDVLIPKNRKITAAEIGLLATVGKNKVLVAKHPKVLIVSTGDELVEVSENPLEYQIRRSNVYSLQALLLALGVLSDTKHLADDKSSLLKEIGSSLHEYDVLLFSGAVSKGKFDYIPEVLDELGVEKLFHKVKQRPGKPFWFGRIASLISSQTDPSNVISNKIVVFAFPGNPVSTYVNCLKYFYPWYQKSVFGMESAVEQAVLSVDFNFKPRMTYFLQVQLQNVSGEVLAIPLTGNGSGDLANLTEADALLELPADRTEFKKGEAFSVIRYRKL
jgi:molybdopterin molybdotransferase